ncbi:unnamed protein product [Leuciscus chuanchicus]
MAAAWKSVDSHITLSVAITFVISIEFPKTGQKVTGVSSIISQAIVEDAGRSHVARLTACTEGICTVSSSTSKSQQPQRHGWENQPQTKQPKFRREAGMAAVIGSKELQKETITSLKDIKRIQGH